MTISFTDADVTIWTGCRSVTEDWGFDNSGLGFDVGPIIRSDPPCSGEAALADGRLLEFLHGVDSWTLRSADKITLKGGPDRPTEVELTRGSG
jgi:hypothetical protein